MQVIEIPEWKGEEPTKVLNQEPPSKHQIKFELVEKEQVRAVQSFCSKKAPVYAKRDDTACLYTNGRQVNTHDWPHRTVVQLLFQITQTVRTDGKTETKEIKQYATGTMVGPKHVLTSFSFNKDKHINKITVCYSSGNLEERQMIHQAKVTKVCFNPNHRFAILVLDEYIGVKTGFISIAYNKTDVETQKTHVYTLTGFPIKASHVKNIAEVTGIGFQIKEKNDSFVVKQVRDGKSRPVLHTSESRGVKIGMYVELEFPTTEQRIAGERPLFKSIIEEKQLGNESLIALLRNMTSVEDSTISNVVRATKLGYQVEDFLTTASNTSVQFVLDVTMVRNTYVPLKWHGMPFVAFADKKEYDRITDFEYRYRWTEGFDQGTFGSPVTTDYVKYGISGTFIVAMHAGHTDDFCYANRITEPIFNELVEVLKETWN